MSEPDDAELLARVRGGDLHAFGTLYTRHHAATLRAARRWTRQPADAADVASEAFANVLRAIKAGKGPADHLWPYLLVSVRNASAALTRRAAPVGLTDDHALLDDVAPDVSELALRKVSPSEVARAFGSLPAMAQQILIAMEIDACKPAEIAGQLGLTANTVSARGARARKALRVAFHAVAST